MSLAAAAPALAAEGMRVVIDRNGRVRYRVEGFTEESFRALEGVVERLLAES